MYACITELYTNCGNGNNTNNITGVTTVLTGPIIIHFFTIGTYTYNLSGTCAAANAIAVQHYYTSITDAYES